MTNKTNKTMTERLKAEEPMSMAEKLDKLWTVTDAELIGKVLGQCTIFDKIEFSSISKETIKKQIHHLKTVQVPNRTVLLHMDDERLAECWFKNWLHPKLKHAVRKPPIQNALYPKIAFLNMYENGQQNFKYSLQEVEDYCNNIGDVCTSDLTQ